MTPAPVTTLGCSQPQCSTSCNKQLSWLCQIVLIASPSPIWLSQFRQSFSVMELCREVAGAPCQGSLTNINKPWLLVNGSRCIEPNSLAYSEVKSVCAIDSDGRLQAILYFMWLPWTNLLVYILYLYMLCDNFDECLSKMGWELLKETQIIKLYATCFWGIKILP